VIGTVAVGGRAVTYGTASRGLGGLLPRPVPSGGLPPRPCSPLLAVPNVTAHPSTASNQLLIVHCGTIVVFAL